MDEKGEKKMGNIKLINNIIKILEENWDFDKESLVGIMGDLEGIKEGDVVNFDNDRWDMDLNISYESEEEWEELKKDYLENFGEVEISEDGNIISGDCWVSIKVRGE